MSSYQKSQKAHKILLKQLKNQGLQLTSQYCLSLPSPKQSAPSIMTKIFSLISNQQIKFNLKLPKSVWPIDQDLFIITHCNTIAAYEYKKQSEKFSIILKHQFNMEEIVHSLLIPYSQNISEFDFYYFIVMYKSSNLISLFIVNNKKNRQIQKKQQIRIGSQVLGAQFISRDQLLFLTKNFQIYHFKIIKSALKKISCIGQLKDLNNIEAGTDIIFVKMFCKPNEQQDNQIVIFYAVWNESTNKGQISVKQMIRHQNGTIKNFKKHFQLFMFHFSKQDLQKVTIVQFAQYFLLQLNHEIFIIKKLYERYIKLDAITQISTSFKSLLISKNVPIICTISQESIQLWEISLNNKIQKCHCQLIDVINFKQASTYFQKNLIRFWVFKNNNNAQVLFIADKSQIKLSVYGVSKKNKVQKLVSNIKKGTEKAKISKIQQLGSKLGVDRKTFYLKLWTQNIQNPGNIYQYLLQCYDFGTIKSQLSKYMRRKAISVGQLIKIQIQIERILFESLKQNLDISNLKWYLKTNFQRRKLQLYNFSTLLTFKEFDEIYFSSIYKLIQKSIDKNLFPEKYSSNILWENTPKNEPQIDIKQVLQHFKLLLIQNYQTFILKLFQNYETSIAKIIDNYPYFLPIKNNEQRLESFSSMKSTNFLLKQSLSLRQNVKSQPWFNQVSQSEWQNELASTQYIFKNLYPFHSTHQITNLLNKLTNSQWNFKNRYIKHSLITLSCSEFKQNVKKFQGEKIYLSVCQLANKIAYQINNKMKSTTTSLQELNMDKQPEDLQQFKEHISQGPQILNILRKKNGLIGSSYQKCLLYTKMHQFMTSKHIIDIKVSIGQLMSLSYSNLISTFFLGNKHNKASLLGDYMNLYDNKKEFYSVLKQYIDSQNCSKVQLEILIKQLKDKDKKFKFQHDYIAELIIKGFCSRIQIRQINDAITFIKFFKEVALKSKLILKLDKLICIRDECAKILAHFNCDKLKYEVVLNQPQTVISMMMQNYFSQNNSDKSDTIEIQKKQICLDFIQNTFSVVLFLKEKIYPNYDQKKLSLHYGKILVQWSQFQTLKSIFYDIHLTQNSQFQSKDYFLELICICLDQLYNDQNIFIDEEIKNHIKNILDLLETDIQHPIILREKAKLQIAQILQTWGYSIKARNLQLMCVKWQQTDRHTLIYQLFDNCIDFINLKNLLRLYQLLQITDKGKKQVQIRTQQSIQFAIQLAERLCKTSERLDEIQERYEEITKIIFFINKDQKNYKAKYQLMIQNFLFTLLHRQSSYPKILEDNINQNYFKPSSNFLSVRKRSGSQSSMISNKSNISNKSYLKNLSNLKLDSKGVALKVYTFYRQQQSKVNNQTKYVKADTSQYLQLKSLIQYFVTNWQNSYAINQFYKQGFSSKKTINFPQKITVNQNLCLIHDQQIIPIEINLDYLWNIVKKVCLKCIHVLQNLIGDKVNLYSKQLQEKFGKYLCYNYFFLLMSLKHPNLGLKQILHINYEYLLLFQTIIEFENSIKKQKGNFLSFDFQKFYSIFNEGIKSIIITKVKQKKIDLNITKNISEVSLDRLFLHLSKQIQFQPSLIKIYKFNQSKISAYTQSRQTLFQMLKKYKQQASPVVSKKAFSIQERQSKQFRTQRKPFVLTLKDVQEVKRKLQADQSFQNDKSRVIKEITQAIQTIQKDCEEQVYTTHKKADLIYQTIFKKKQSQGQFPSFLQQKQASIVIEKHTRNPFKFGIFEQQSEQQNQKNIIYPEVQSQAYNKSEKFEGLRIPYLRSQHFNQQNGESSFQIQSNQSDDSQNNYWKQIKSIKFEQGVEYIAKKFKKFNDQYLPKTQKQKQDLINNMKQFSKQINIYEGYFTKKSSPYMEKQSLKKILKFDKKTLIQMIHQLYNTQQSVTLILSQKDKKANQTKKQKGLKGQQERYLNISFYFYINLISKLALGDSVKLESLQISLKQTNLEDLQLAKYYLKKIFSLTYIIFPVQQSFYESQIEEVLSKIQQLQVLTSEECNIQVFQMILKFTIDYLYQIKKRKQQKNQQENIQHIDQNVNLNHFKQIIFCYLICRMGIIQQTLQQTKQKFQYLLSQVSKQQIGEVYNNLACKILNTQLKQIFIKKMAKLFQAQAN